VPRVLHPEFGYLGIPTFGRKLIMLALCGSVAVVAGVNVFKAGGEPDPTSAMALAPTEALGNTVLVSPAEKGEFAQKIPNTRAPRSDCQNDATEYLARNCAAVKPRRPRSILAINERPPIAAVAIGHRDEPAVLPSEPVVPAAATSEEPRPNSPDTAEAVSAVEITPAPAVTTQTRSSQARPHGKNQNTSVQHRYRLEYHFSSNYRHGHSNYSHDYVQSGYARLW
jgi:hypothetical protein